MSSFPRLPLPPFFDPKKVEELWPVPYQERFADARHHAQRHGIQPAASDRFRVCLVAIDVQNTFCLPQFELFVGGRSGQGAIADNRRLCEFIYGNLGNITEIVTTMDTHTAMQIFHPIFWVNAAGEHPQPAATVITLEDVETGVWQVNPAVAHSVANGNYLALQKYARHYVAQLTTEGKYPLTVWPYHGMLGGLGHGLVPSVEEALFVHNVARQSQTIFEMKGGNPLTENYSVLRPEVLTDAGGQVIARKNTRLMERLLSFDVVIIAGQAKSHCVAWTIADLLAEIQSQDPRLAQKVYLLEDCTSPVVVPGLVDFTDQADAAFQGFADGGMHVVTSAMAVAEMVQGCLPRVS